MKVLVNCYACSPYKGSEPGMGWNFVRCLSQYHELHVITESKFQLDLERYLSGHPEYRNNLTFYYIKRERHQLLRKIWPPSYYWYYRDWQRKAFSLARELHKCQHFNLVHQLNMIGYREPGYLYKMDIPFIWGPIGGFNITPWQLLSSMGVYGSLFYACRNLINLCQMYFSMRVRQAVKRSRCLIAATAGDDRVIYKLYRRSSILISEVGVDTIKRGIDCIIERNGKMKLCWSGLHIPRKALNLLLEAVALCKYRDQIELHILGNGGCTEKWKRLAKRLNINNTYWYGWLDKEAAMQILRSAHIFAITSLSDATSTVLLEALSCGLPVIALDHLGFSDVVTDTCGVKIKVGSKKQIIRDFAYAIDLLYENESFREALSIGALERAQHYTWEEKAKKINHLYSTAVGC